MAEKRRDQQKLWLILFQIKAIRVRVNSLAAQYFAFSTLGLIVAAAALVITAALLLGPLLFLLTAIVVALAASTGMVRVIRSALNFRASSLTAAGLADERADLKGRLMTVLEMAERRPQSALWPYLVEDTYGRRAEFEPSKIEPRWLSHSLFALVGICLGALLLLRFAYLRRGSQSLAMNGLSGELTADIRNLDIQPADPALEPNAVISGDQATMQKLAGKLALQENARSGKGGLSQWMGKARNLAGELQNKITGRQGQPPLRLRLTDKDGTDSDRSSRPRGGSDNHTGGNQAASPGNSPGGNSPGQPEQPPEPLPDQQTDQLAQNGAGFPGQTGPNPAEPNPGDIGSLFAGGTGSGGGSSHGAGSDPEHLFGPQSSQPLGSDNFKITIDAQPSDESSIPGAPAYIPPKVRVPLNGSQHPDEPIARTTVPSTDQMTIKRVFAR